MDMLLFLIGFLGFIGVLVLFIVNIFRKKPKKKLGISMIVCLALMIVGLSMPSSDDKVEKEPNVAALIQDTVKEEEQIKKSDKEPVQEPVAEPEPEPTPDPIVEQPKVVEVDVVVTAKEVIDLFEENEIKGKQTYTGKLAEITGVVGDVGEIFNSIYVTLGTGADFEFITLQCFFVDDAEIDKVAELKPGDKITIIGTIGEQSFNIAVNDCVFK